MRRIGLGRRLEKLERTMCPPAPCPACGDAPILLLGDDGTAPAWVGQDGRCTRCGAGPLKAYDRRDWEAL